MSRRRTQDSRGWVDEGPRAANPAAVSWSLSAHDGPSPASRARTRDISSGDYRSYQPREVTE